MLYSKNGSIPRPTTDGTEGWMEVPDRPDAPEGKQVVWWYPPGWVIRDPRPEPVAGFEWNWSQLHQQWVLNKLPSTAPFPSWVFNEEAGEWKAPVPYPADGAEYVWDEATVSWVPAPTISGSMTSGVVDAPSVVSLAPGDGAQDGSFALANNITDTGLIIGNNLSLTADFAGYIDDLRITKGVAGYTANFTPSSVSHPLM